MQWMENSSCATQENQYENIKEDKPCKSNYQIILVVVKFLELMQQLNWNINFAQD